MLNLVTAKTSNILTIEEAQNHLRVDSDDDISYVEALIYAAENHLNEICGRSYVAETYDYYLKDFADPIILPLAPIASIASVKYFDSDNVEQTLVEDTDYYNDLISEPCTINMGDISNYPDVYDKPNAVTIRFTTGVTSPNIIPLEYKQAALLLIGEMYADREDKIKRFPTVAEKLVSNLRLYL